MLSRALSHSSTAALPYELSHSLSLAYDLNSKYNAFTSISPHSDIKNQFSLAPKGGALHGVPIGIKDVFCTRELPTTAGSKMLNNYSSPIEATIVKKLREAGGVVIGKTNMDEFGMGSANLNSYFGPVLNPSGPEGSSEERVAGGSSGGSAAAVAAGFCRIALASDTGGSTRLPAAHCGVVGFKPSYGMLSRWGMIAYASSLDCVGIMAREVDDVKATFNILSEHDPKDPTSVSQETRQRAIKNLEKQWAIPSSETSLAGLRVGVPAEFFLAELSPLILPSISKTLTLLKSLGAELVSVSLPSTSKALGAYYVLASAEASSNLARYDGIRFGERSATDLPLEGEEHVSKPLYAETRSQGFGKEVQKRLLLGAFALSADAFNNYYLQSQFVRQTLRHEFGSIFRSSSALSTSSNSSPPTDGIDVLLHPTTISTAPPLVQTPMTGTESYMQDILNVPASLAGLPALSLPAGRAEDGWPVGVQIVGQWGEDEVVLKVAKVLEGALK